MEKIRKACCADKKRDMRIILNITLLICSLAIFVLEYQVQGAGDLVKIDKLTKLKWPLYVVASLVAVSLLVSLIRFATKSASHRANRLRLLIDALSTVVVVGCFWLIAKM
jgi:hypothetical protein